MTNRYLRKVDAFMTILLKTLLIMILPITIINVALLVTEFTYNGFYFVMFLIIIVKK
jgi:hypothetical protein